MQGRMSRIGRRVVSGTRKDATDARRLAHDTFTRKGPERQFVVQVLKSVVAAMLAWLIAIHLLDVRQPFVAPMIALLMVQPTIVQSLVKGTQQVAAVTVGMLTALVVFGLVDNTIVALGIALLITTAFAAWRRMGDQGTYAPIVALTMISLQSVGETYFERRLLETVVGVVVGAAINVAVKPPHYLDSARASATTCVDDATGILRDVSDGLRSGWGVDDARGWVTRADRLQVQVERCLEDLGWAGESVRLEPRPSQGRHRLPDNDIPSGDRRRRKCGRAPGALRSHARDPRQGRPGWVARGQGVPRRLRNISPRMERTDDRTEREAAVPRRPVDRHQGLAESRAFASREQASVIIHDCRRARSSPICDVSRPRHVIVSVSATGVRDLQVR